MAITETIPSITGYTGTIPDKATQTKTDFANSINPYLNYVDNTFIPSYEAAKTSLNTFATQANSLAIEVNNSAELAMAAVNYKGDWVAGYATTGYSLGMSVTYTDGYNYVSKINNNLVEPTTMTNTTEWNFIEAVDPNTVVLKSGSSMSGALNLSRATVASSATTSDIWSSGNQIYFTGTATVTAFPNAPQAGAERTLICAGACSFTASANMVIDGVTSGNTVTCAANDKVIVRATSTTTFNLSRIKADGTSQGQSGLVLLATAIASSSPTIDFDGYFSSAYDDYMLLADSVVPATDSVTIRAIMKTSGAWDTGTNYFLAAFNSSSSTATDHMTLTTSIGNASGEGVDMRMFFFKPTSTTQFKRTLVEYLGHTAAGAATCSSNINTHQVLTADEGIRIYATTGNIASGTFRLYGISK